MVDAFLEVREGSGAHVLDLVEDGDATSFIRGSARVGPHCGEDVWGVSATTSTQEGVLQDRGLAGVAVP
ncbi:MAG: hypothetical protein IPK85_00440 [Gemmatimonadetes bacterium]|nr:hypothetical protein [Gemmatimonadota bacterium]